MQMVSRKVIAVSIAVVVVVISLILAFPILQHTSSDAQTNTSNSNTVYFTIIESDRGTYEGMNGSAYHLGEAWPVIKVSLGDTVIIHIISENSTEAHGFTIGHYFDPGVGLLPGGTYTVKFVANENGTFIITCLIFCAIHPLMDYGKFIVTS